MNREQCISDLMEKAKSLQCWKEFRCGTNVVRFKDSDEPIPPYIPQVGNQYFEDNRIPRILMYAMNANLNDKKTIKDLTDLKSRFGVEHFYDILNGTSDQNEYYVKGIGPYPHMNMLARLLLYAWKGKVLKFEECVENTATTNLIKCSTMVGRSTPNLIMYGNCTRNICLHEIEILKPEIIIAMGSEVFYSLVHTLGFKIDDQYGRFAQPKINDENRSLPQSIIYDYHSTGPIRAHFKALQNHFDKGGKRPKACRPYLKMLTDRDYKNSQDYWALGKTRYEEYKNVLETEFSDFFNQEKNWYGSNRDYFFYFACHLGLFNKLADTINIAKNEGGEL